MELMRLGGAKTILATVTSGKAMSAMIPGLAVRGRLVVIGVGMDPIEVSPLDLIGASRTVTGHAARRFESIRRTPWPSAH